MLVSQLHHLWHLLVFILIVKNAELDDKADMEIRFLRYQLLFVSSVVFKASTGFYAPKSAAVLSFVSNFCSFSANV